MRVDELPRIVGKKRDRRGQGRGAGSGHTSGRGHKGQKARGKIGILFEGTKWKKSLVRRLPLLGGKGKMKARSKPAVVGVERLAVFASGARVDVAAMVAKKLVEKEAVRRGVKIVGKGKLERSMEVVVPVTAGARETIEKAGGKVMAGE